uniref:Putative product n=1 Tax=Xenopsylla cheopis TaxID=163159 RepID=A0A6M2DYX7_XENCH
MGCLANQVLPSFAVHIFLMVGFSLSRQLLRKALAASVQYSSSVGRMTSAWMCFCAVVVTCVWIPIFVCNESYGFILQYL